jgi:hypothetical protein
MPAADPASKPLLATSVVKPTSSQLSNPEIVVELWLLGRLIPLQPQSPQERSCGRLDGGVYQPIRIQNSDFSPQQR